MNKTLLLVVCPLSLIIALVMPCVSRASESEIKDEMSPLRPAPERRASMLPDPDRAMRLELALILHKAQELELKELQHNVDVTMDVNSGWRSHFIMGLGFALEEYYQMELSYPDCVKQLTTSGYLIPEWENLYLYVYDFNSPFNNLSDKDIIYIPQPFGLVKLINVPGKSCAYRMRCYLEYSLCVPDCFTSYWINDSNNLCTEWMSSFQKFGVTEIMHVNNTKPELSTCSLCQPH